MDEYGLWEQFRDILEEELASEDCLDDYCWAGYFGIYDYTYYNFIFSQIGINRSTLGLEAHHLIEKRFGPPGAGAMQEVLDWQGQSTGDWSCVILKKASEHQLISQEWIGYIGKETGPIGSLGVRTSTATLDHIEYAAQQIYADCPEILEALGLE